MFPPAMLCSERRRRGLFSWCALSQYAHSDARIPGRLRNAQYVAFAFPEHEAVSVCCALSALPMDRGWRPLLKAFIYSYFYIKGAL